MAETDLISRQAAIDILKSMAVPRYLDSECEDIYERDRTLDKAIDAMRSLPSAQPERRNNGHWIFRQLPIGPMYICSECKDVCCWRYRFCPSCGAKMDEF